MAEERSPGGAEEVQEEHYEETGKDRNSCFIFSDQTKHLLVGTPITSTKVAITNISIVSSILSNV